MEAKPKRGGTEGRRLTKLEADGGLRGVGNGVAGDAPRAAPRVLRGERPRAHGNVDPLHRRPPRVGEAPGRTGATVPGGGLELGDFGFIASVNA